MKPVPMLARIRVATPCHADWSEMTGDERVRHCAHCNKNVFNLSELSREQAERLIIEKNGDLCARYYQRTDGTILLADCSVGIRQKRTTRVLAAGAAALLAGTGGVAGFLRLSHHEKPMVKVDVEETRPMGLVNVEPPPPPDVEAVQGDIAPPPEVHEMKGQMIEVQAPPPPVEAIQGGISVEPPPPVPVHAKMGKPKR